MRRLDLGQRVLYEPSSLRAFLASPLATILSPSRRRVRVLDLCSFRCILPAWRCITLPVPVIRNRFLAPECVFIFGMLPLTFSSWVSQVDVGVHIVGRTPALL